MRDLYAPVRQQIFDRLLDAREDLSKGRQGSCEPRTPKTEAGQKQAQDESVPSDMVMSLWTVAFLDLLGYRSILEAMDVFPFPEGGPEQETLTKAFARAMHLRRRLIHGVEEFMTAHDNMPLPNLARFPREAQGLAARWRRIKILRTPGPDHIVMGCSLMPNEQHFPLRAVYTLVVACAAAMMIQLMMGGDDPSDTLPLRGGIDIATGCLDPRDSYLYSPALASAYHLERKEAVYARTIIGEQFQGYLTNSATNPERGLELDYSRALAKAIADMFIRDRDGKVTLDFFGASLRERLSPVEAKDMAEKAWNFSCASAERFRRGGDAHIAEKYEWLVEYMRPRLGLWGVSS